MNARSDWISSSIPNFRKSFQSRSQCGALSSPIPIKARMDGTHALIPSSTGPVENRFPPYV